MCSTMPTSLRLLRCAAMVLCLQILGRTAHALDTDGECIVQREQILKTPLNISILEFISPEHPLQFVLAFRDLDYVYYRDVLYVSNYAAIHYKVRGGKSSNTSHPLHLMVSEGWNRLRLVADGRHLSLKWIDKNDEADLLALTLDFPINTMSLEGLFSVCSGDSPEWDVGDGQQATVPLHPLKSEQQLVVTEEASSMSYLITDSGPIPIVTNTTLTVKIQRQNSTSVITIVQESLELLRRDVDATSRLRRRQLRRDNDVLRTSLSMQQSLRPVITVGSKGGNTHLRLCLSDPQEEQEHSRGPHPESQTITNMYILIGVLAGLLSLFILATITLACFLIKRRESHADQPYDDGNMKNKRTVETNAAPDERLWDKSSDEASKYPRLTPISICEDKECLAEKEHLMQADHSLTYQRMRDELAKVSGEGRYSHQPQQPNACTDGRQDALDALDAADASTVHKISAMEPVSIAYDSDRDSAYKSLSMSSDSSTRSHLSSSSSFQSWTDTPIPLTTKHMINVAPDDRIMDKSSNEASKHPSLMGVSIQEV